MAKGGRPRAEKKTINIALQGGGSHGAFAWGILDRLLEEPNILDAFGKDWFEMKEGEASVFKPDGSGKATLVARVQAVDWIGAAGGN